ncbi:hypothetical protein FRC11_013205, partial [Ceratobasidium sp. 423]
GAPSDEELDSAHNAVRTLEGLAHGPFFDSILSVKLSQHLFNIQFARYIRDSDQGHFAQRPMNPPPPPQANDNEPAAPDTGRQTKVTDQAGPQNTPPAGLDPGGPTTQAALPNHGISELISILKSQVTSDQFSSALQETNQLLSGNNELLTDIRRTLASTQILTFPNETNISGTQPHKYHSYRKSNNEGEIPWVCGEALGLKF